NCNRRTYARRMEYGCKCPRGASHRYYITRDWRSPGTVWGLSGAWPGLSRAGRRNWVLSRLAKTVKVWHYNKSFRNSALISSENNRSYPIDLSVERILVTGGAGFVGSNVVQHLLRDGASVIVLDDFYTGSEANLPMGHRSLEVVKGSVTDFDLVRDTVRRSTIVIHLAARNIIVSTKNPREDYEVNIGGTLNVLLAVREAGIRP